MVLQSALSCINDRAASNSTFHDVLLYHSTDWSIICSCTIYFGGFFEIRILRCRISGCWLRSQNSVYTSFLWEPLTEFLFGSWPALGAPITAMDLCQPRCFARAQIWRMRRSMLRRPSKTISILDVLFSKTGHLHHSHHHQNGTHPQ